jgi:hypothetical protein
MRTIAAVLVLLMCLAGVAAADQRFHPLPAQGKARSGLKLKVVKYDGSTNGRLTVAVKNPGTKPVKFAAEGLYFVPDGDPDQAPQRLGAVGPLRIAADTGAAPITSLEVAAGATVEVELDVFCIDSHRSSPSSANTFTVGTRRLPRELATTIERRAKAAAETFEEGYAAPDAPSAIQGEVWKARDAKWIKLDGESAQEAHK